MHVSQVVDTDGKVLVIAREGRQVHIVKSADNLLSLVHEAIENAQGLSECIAAHGFGDQIDLGNLDGHRKQQLPIHHPDPTHMHLTGTGLTHLGSAATRDAMHAQVGELEDEEVTDSMKMFRMGLEDGRPEKGAVGAQPEWFYKGNGTMAVSPGQSLMSPGFAEDGGEEPEIAGIYVIGPDGTPFRVGFALANEFSDHVTERQNYLFLAHSKLRPCSFGPEILLGELPSDVQGVSRILRNGETFWEKPFASGEANMSHTIANLEHHHFKYDVFCQPGDVHVHMFGTATLSFADNIKTKAGDVFEIESSTFGLPLRNSLQEAPQSFSARQVQVL